MCCRVPRGYRGTGWEGEVIGALAHLPHGLAARLAGWRARPGALVWHPPPPSGGDPARARRLARGVLLFDGRLVETEAPTPWELPAPDRAWSDCLHGHGWLDDSAAADDPELWRHFEHWVWGWIDRHAGGTGPGWRVELVARRLTRWIACSVRLLRGCPPERSRTFFRALAGHARYLAWRWPEAEGAARIEALGGLVYATLSLEGSGPAAARAIRALGREAAIIRSDGGIDSRNPEGLAGILATLCWCAATIGEAGMTPAEGHLAAIRRAAPALAALTTPAGLARFHGGRGAGDLSVAKAAGAGQAPERAMGFARLELGPAVLILDAAPPPAGRHAATAHDSALAFELTLGRQPVFVNCGSGVGFDERAAIAGRLAPAQSTVAIGDGPGRLRASRGGPPLLGARGEVALTLRRGPEGVGALVESTLYARELGVVVGRRLDLSRAGAGLAGEDTVRPAGSAARAAPDSQPRAVTARFHLHPEVRALPALGGRAVALTLPDGSRWRMQAEGDIALQPSVHYDETHARPRATMQIVATAPLIGYSARIAWTLECLANGAADAPARHAVTAP